MAARGYFDRVVAPLQGEALVLAPAVRPFAAAPDMPVGPDVSVPNFSRPDRPVPVSPQPSLRDALPLRGLEAAPGVAPPSIAAAPPMLAGKARAGAAPATHAVAIPAPPPTAPVVPQPVTAELALPGPDMFDPAPAMPPPAATVPAFTEQVFIPPAPRAAQPEGEAMADLVPPRAAPVELPAARGPAERVEPKRDAPAPEPYAAPAEPLRQPALAVPTPQAAPRIHIGVVEVRAAAPVLPPPPPPQPPRHAAPAPPARGALARSHGWRYGFSQS